MNCFLASGSGFLSGWLWIDAHTRVSNSTLLWRWHTSDSRLNLTHIHKYEISIPQMPDPGYNCANCIEGREPGVLLIHEKEFECKTSSTTTIWSITKIKKWSSEKLSLYSNILTASRRVCSKLSWCPRLLRPVSLCSATNLPVYQISIFETTVHSFLGAQSIGKAQSNGKIISYPTNETIGCRWIVISHLRHSSEGTQNWRHNLYSDWDSHNRF